MFRLQGEDLVWKKKQNLFYIGDGNQTKPPEAVSLPILTNEDKPEHYIADSELVDACNVALLLSQPLLLTGEPGSGKTQFAYSLAYELGFEDPHRFDTKSTSTAKELFYTYDALRRFQDAHPHPHDKEKFKNREKKDYIHYNALGEAILRTCEYEKIKDLVPQNFKRSTPARSIVLIDEIDKAPRDFPNDLLNEVENACFEVSELDNHKVEADTKFKPIIILTSNSEKDLPDPFLRRCIYYNIPFPEDEKLKKILQKRLGDLESLGSDFLKSAIEVFKDLREGGLQKKPSLAELLSWVQVMREKYKDSVNPLKEYGKDLGNLTLSCLVKDIDDRKRSVSILKKYDLF